MQPCCGENKDLINKRDLLAGTFVSQSRRNVANLDDENILSLLCCDNVISKERR